MACTRYEDRILDYPQLPAALQAQVDAHLAGCADCRELARLLGQLDDTLARELRPPTLSAHFGERLWRRIETETARSCGRDPAARRLAFEAEYAARRQRLRRQLWSFGGLLDGLAGASVAGFAGWVLTSQLPRLSGWWPTAGPAAISAQLAITSVLASIFVAGAIGFAFRQRFGRWLSMAM